MNLSHDMGALFLGLQDPVDIVAMLTDLSATSWVGIALSLVGLFVLKRSFKAIAAVTALVTGEPLSHFGPSAQLSTIATFACGARLTSSS